MYTYQDATICLGSSQNGWAALCLCSELIATWARNRVSNSSLYEWKSNKLRGLIHWFKKNGEHLRNTVLFSYISWFWKIGVFVCQCRRLNLDFLWEEHKSSLFLNTETPNSSRHCLQSICTCVYGKFSSFFLICFLSFCLAADLLNPCHAE